MTTNVLLRDLDLVLPQVAAGDGRRLEVVVDGLPLFGGAQLAVDTTLVCALRTDGQPTTRAAVESQKTQGSHVPRTRRQTRPGTLGSVGCRGGRKIFLGDTILLDSTGQSQGP